MGPVPPTGRPGRRAVLVPLVLSAAVGVGVETDLPPRLLQWTPGVGAVPGLIYGTAWKKERTDELVVKAVRAGFRAFDTAAHPLHYNESLVGVALSTVLEDKSFKLGREDVWVQTKFTPNACDQQPEEHHPYDKDAGITAQVRQSYESSLRRLGLTYVDSYLLHAPYPTNAKTLEAWREMENIHDESKGNTMLGISNVNLGQLRNLMKDARVKPAFVQNRCLQKNNYDHDLRAFCNENGISYQGFWLLTGNRHVTADPGFGRMAKAIGRDKSQIFYRFFFQRLGVIILSGSKNEDHMRDDQQLDQFSLSEEQEREIRELEAPRFTDADKVTFTVTNMFDDSLHLFWKNPDTSVLVPQGEIAPGRSTSINTRHSHVFEGKIGEAIKFMWRADREKGETQKVFARSNVDVTFRNQGTEVLSVIWRKSESGEEVPQGDVALGASLEVSAHLGYNFVVRTAGGSEVLLWEAHLETPGKQVVDLGLSGARSGEL